MISVLLDRNMQRYEIFTVDGQQLWDHAAEFTTWQHPAMERGARSVVCVYYYRPAVCQVVPDVS